MNVSKAMVCILACAFPVLVFAQGSQGQGQGTGGQSGQSQMVQSQNGGTGTAQGQQIINQNQNQVQNQGDEVMIQSQQQEMEQEGEPQNGEGNGLGNQENQQYGQGRSDQALEKMSDVAKKVQELQMLEGTEAGLGQQVREIVQNQTQSQTRVQEQIRIMDSRQGVLKTILGPEYKAMNQIRREIAENELRIRQMEDYANQLGNQAEATKIREMIQLLTEQNTALQERLGEEEQVKSMFGWLMRLFQK